MSKRSFFSAIAILATVSCAVAAGTTWTGKITDAMCDKDHSMMATGGKQPDPKECTLACVKSGSKFVFVSSGKVYEISNQDLPALKTYAGTNVQLSGELSSDGKTIKAESVSAAK
jgi:hypothetical protein